MKILAMILVGMVLIGFGTIIGLSLNQLQGTIVGKAYVDFDNDRAIKQYGDDNRPRLPYDPYRDSPADGLRVILYKIEKYETYSQGATVAETIVKNGEYRFSVKPGEYFIDAVQDSKNPDKSKYSSVYVAGDSIHVDGGKLIIGPTIILGLK